MDKPNAPHWPLTHLGASLDQKEERRGRQNANFHAVETHSQMNLHRIKKKKDTKTVKKHLPKSQQSIRSLSNYFSPFSTKQMSQRSNTKRQINRLNLQFSSIQCSPSEKTHMMRASLSFFFSPQQWRFLIAKIADICLPYYLQPRLCLWIRSIKKSPASGMYYCCEKSSIFFLNCAIRGEIMLSNCDEPFEGALLLCL